MPIRLTLPGRADLLLEHAVFDINGTLTLDGSLLAGVEERIDRLRRDIQVHLASSDTFGTGAPSPTGSGPNSSASSRQANPWPRRSWWSG